MRRSSKKTTSAVLRSIIGIKDFEMAEILECSPATIHSLESGRLKLSDSLAMRMSHETGVAIDWLLDGDPKVLPYARNGTLFTRDAFDRVRSFKLLPMPLTRELIEYDAHQFSEALVSILQAGYEKGESELVHYKIWRAIAELAKEFGADEIWKRQADILRDALFARHEWHEEHPLTGKKWPGVLFSHGTTRRGTRQSPAAKKRRRRKKRSSS